LNRNSYFLAHDILNPVASKRKHNFLPHLVCVYALHGLRILYQTSCVGGRHNMAAPCKLTFDLLTLKVFSTFTSLAILVFLGLSVLDLGPMYETDRQTDRHT